MERDEKGLGLGSRGDALTPVPPLLADLAVTVANLRGESEESVVATLVAATSATGGVASSLAGGSSPLSDFGGDATSTGSSDSTL